MDAGDRTTHGFGGRILVKRDTQGPVTVAVTLAPPATAGAPTAIERAEDSSHHREAVLVFEGREEPIRIVVKNVGGVAERNFAWQLE